MSQLGEDGGSFFGSAERLKKELERVLDRVKDQGEKALDSMGLRPGVWQPAADVVETGDQVDVTFDMPGLTADAVAVELVGNMLTITGTRPEAEPVAGQIVHQRHRPTGKFSKSIPLPIAVDHEQVAAEMHNGVLSIRLAKSEKAKPHKVPITEKA